MSNNSFYQSGPGALDTNNPTVIPNSFDGVMTPDGGCSHFSPAQRVAFAGRAAGTLQITVGGSVTTDDVVALSVEGPSLPAGVVAVSYEALAGDSVTNVAQGLAAAINNNAVLQQFEISATSYKAVVTVSQNGPMSAFTSVVNTSAGGNSETLTFNNQNADTVLVGGTVPADKWTATVGGSETDGNVVTLRFTAVGLPSGHKDVSYTTQTSDTLALIATGLRTAINADSDLIAANITCPSISTSTTLNISSAGPAYMSALTYTQGSNTETMTIVHVTRETLVLRFTSGSFAGGHEDVSYLVVNGDTVNTIATHLAAAINADVVLENDGITASVASATITVKQVGLNFATLSNQTSGSPGETLTIADPSGGLLGGSGLAIPMNNFNAMVNGVLLRLRYGIPEALSPQQLAAAAAAGPIK